MNDTKRRGMVNLEHLLTEPTVRSAPPDKKAEVVSRIIADYLGKYDILEVDLSHTRTLTPSFAYNAFGRLYDLFKESLINRLVFTNDPNELSDRIIMAIERRKQVLLAHGS